MNENNSVETQVNTVETTSENKPDVNTGQPENNGISDGDLEKRIDKLVQARSDRLQAENGKTIAALKQEIETLKKASMTAEEVKNYEISEREKTLAAREADLRDKENRLTAVNVLKEVGLDDGTPESTEMLDFIMGVDEKEIKAKAAALKKIIDKRTEIEVGKVFSGSRTVPPKGGDTAPVNPSLDAVKMLGDAAGKRAERSKSIRDNFLNRK